MTTNDRTFTVASGATTGSVFLEEWDTFGLEVPTITAGTLTIQVSNDNANWDSVYDEAGVQVLTYASGTGNFSISSIAMAHIAAYRFMRVLCGAAQGGDRTFRLCFKKPRRGI